MTFPKGITGQEIAASIGPGLAKAALIAEVNGKPWDLFRPIEEDARLRIITRKDPEALELITPEDLPKIEEEMRKIIKAGLPTRREVWARDQAVAHFKGIGESYKAE